MENGQFYTASSLIPTSIQFEVQPQKLIHVLNKDKRFLINPYFYMNGCLKIHLYHNENSTIELLDRQLFVDFNAIKDIIYKTLESKHYGFSETIICEKQLLNNEQQKLFIKSLVNKNNDTLNYFICILYKNGMGVAEQIVYKIDFDVFVEQYQLVIEKLKLFYLDEFEELNNAEYLPFHYLDNENVYGDIGSYSVIKQVSLENCLLVLNKEIEELLI